MLLRSWDQRIATLKRETQSTINNSAIIGNKYITDVPVYSAFM